MGCSLSTTKRTFSTSHWAGDTSTYNTPYSGWRAVSYENEDCNCKCDKEANHSEVKRSDSSPTKYKWGFNLTGEIKGGCCKDLEILWHTCWRGSRVDPSKAVSGAIVKCFNSPSCVVNVTPPTEVTNPTYKEYRTTTSVEVRYRTCDSLTKKMKTVTFSFPQDYAWDNGMWGQ